MNYATFCTLTGEVSIGEQTARLRPKTYLLAQYLSERSGQVISKEELLENVWEGSFVEEQAVFQSINEIRKAFSPTEVIKTYPRKGYEWVVPSQPEMVETHHQETLGGIQRKHAIVICVTALVGLLLLALLIGWPGDKTTQNIALDDTLAPSASTHQALLVLPFDTRQLAQSEQWVSIGAVQAIVDGFTSTTDLTLFQVSDVLDILARVPSITPEPQALFDVSAATHIIEATLSGVPGEYHVAFTVYEHQSRQQGVIHGQSIEDVLSRLVETIGRELAASPTAKRVLFANQFNNALMYNAVQLLASNDLPSAISFLQSAITHAPKNLAAHFLLAKTYQQTGQYAEALEIAQKGIGVVVTNNEDKVYQSRLNYIMAVSLFALGSGQAKSQLEQAIQLSSENEDWLYTAYAKAMLAQYWIKAKRFDEALPLLQASLAYQQMLGCPMGVAQGYLDFVDYYVAKEDAEMANSSYNLALQVVKEKGLTQVEPLLQAQQTKLRTLPKGQ